MLNTPQTSRFRLVVLSALFVMLLGATVAYAEPAAPDRMVHFAGLVQVKPDPVIGNWQIEGRTVMVTAQTRLLPNAAAIQQGDMVVVDAKMRDNALIAHTIVKPQAPAQSLVTGKIVGFTAEKWTIGSQVVLVNSETRLDGDHPDVDDMAMAWVESTGAGLLAKRILVKDPPPPPPGPRFVLFRGIVISLDDAGVYTIQTDEGEKQVKTDDQTRIVGSPVAGDRVLVKGQTQDDGTVLALMIVKLGDNDQQEQTPFAGFVKTVDSSTLPTAAADPMQWVWGVELPAHDGEQEQTWTVVVDADTNINVDPNTVEVGAFIKGAGIKLDDASIQATMVRVTRPPQVRFEGTITAGPDANDAGFPQGVWTIGGKSVTVSADTRLVGEEPAFEKQAAGHGVLQGGGGIAARLLMIR